MEFIKKLKNSFNIGAEKALDTSDASNMKKIQSIKETSGIKQEIDEREPQIEYREIIINDSILYLYRNGKRAFVSGCLDIEEDKIIIYRYKLDEKIKLNSNISFDRFLMEQQKCKDAEFRVLEHEKKHWKNHKLGIKLGFTIPCNCFGAGLNIHHYGCIVVNSHAKIGENCNIQQGVNIGKNYSAENVPTIGNNVYIGPGAKLFGKINIANGCVIGANAVVTKSCNEENMVLVGVPAKIVGRRKEGLV